MLRATLLLSLAAAAQASTVTWTGWFADEQCASAHAAEGNFGPTNPECSKTCLKDGKAPVFISEQAKAVYKVVGYPGVADDLGYHLEITAELNTDAKTLSVQSVKKLSYEGAACGRRKSVKK